MNGGAPAVMASKQASSSRNWFDGLWAELHGYVPTGDPAADRTWLDRFNVRVKGCGGCADHWRLLLQAHPPAFSTLESWRQWTHARHNDVNRRIGKPEVAYAEAARRIGWACGDACACATPRPSPRHLTVLTNDVTANLNVCRSNACTKRMTDRDYARQFGVEMLRDLTVRPCKGGGTCGDNAQRGECPDGWFPHQQAVRPPKGRACPTVAGAAAIVSISDESSPLPPLTYPDPLPPGSVSFPIDLVYLWCDGRDPEFIKAAAKHGINSQGGSRYTDCDELRYSLRSARRFAPWVRTIHIVTNGQLPAWLYRHHPQVRLVTHAEIFEWPEDLPTFCSTSIEQHLHRIPGLAEHFLFANDDMMFGRAVAPEQFFAPDGRARLGMSTRLGNGGGMYKQTVANAARILDRVFGEASRRRSIHHIQPLRKSALLDIRQRLPDVCRTNSAFKTRSAKQVALNLALWPEWMLATGQAEHTRIGSAYINASKVTGRTASPVSLLCINNSTGHHASDVRSLLEEYFPTPSIFELREIKNPPSAATVAELIATDFPVHPVIYPDRIVCLSLDSRPDRWKKFTRSIATSKLLGSIPVTRHRARPIAEMILPEYWTSPKKPPSYYATNMDHLVFIERAYVDGVENLMVFEDDALLHASFDELFERASSRLPIGWKGLWLTRTDRALKPATVANGLLRMRSGYDMSGYMLSRAGMWTVFSYAKSRPLINIDEAADELFAIDPNFYATSPKATIQTGCRILNKRRKVKWERITRA